MTLLFAELLKHYHLAKLSGVWGASPSDVFAVGQVAEAYGLILHYDGASWAEMATERSGLHFGVWGTSTSDIFVVGAGGAILHYDGTSWIAMTSGTHQALSGVWGTSPSDVFAAGGREPEPCEDVVLHYDGTSWTPMAIPTTEGESLYGIWGASPSDVFAAGGIRVEMGGIPYDSVILHYDGNSWTTMNSGYDSAFSSVWASSPTDVFTVGAGGAILHCAGPPQ